MKRKSTNDKFKQNKKIEKFFKKLKKDDVIQEEQIMM